MQKLVLMFQEIEDQKPIVSGDLLVIGALIYFVNLFSRVDE